MKKFILLLGAVLMFTVSCTKSPDLGELDGKFFVQTDYKDGTNFSNYTTVHVSDSILIINNDATTPQVWTDANAQKLIGEFKAKLQSAGYTVVSGKGDLTLQLSGAKNVNIVTGYYWWDYYYWGWYDPCYWWGCCDCYTPGYYPWYPVTYYAYSTGAILGELIDMNNPDSSGKYFSVWSTYIGGVLDDYSSTTNVDRALEGIDQAFAQSPYLKK